MATSAQELDALIRVIRACFQTLKALGDDLHEDVGVTAAMRAVMEHLFDRAPETVPQIARAKTVSRQHIQKLVDALVAAELAELLENPAHIRSPRVSLTPKGKKVFETMRRREQGVLRNLARSIGASDVKAAHETLSVLHTTIKTRLEKKERSNETTS